MKELNYQYKIIEERNINGKNILKIKDDIYDKTIYMEIYTTTDSSDWDKSNEAEREIGKLKDEGKISDYFINDDYSAGVKTFYKIYENYDGYSGNEETLTHAEEVNEQTKEDLSSLGFDDNLSNPVFRDNNNYKLGDLSDSIGGSDNYEAGDLSDSIGAGYHKDAQEFSEFDQNFDIMNDDLDSSSDVNKIADIAEKFIESEPELDAMGNSVVSYESSEVNTIIENGVVKKSEVKLNSYTSNNNKAELERIKNLSKQRQNTTTYNSYSNTSFRSKPKKSGKGGIFFFFLIIGITVSIFVSNRSKRRAKYHSYYSNYNKMDNYEKGADYYKKGSYYSAEIYFKKSCNYDKDKRGCSMLGFLYENGKVYSKQKHKVALDAYVKGCELNDSYSCRQAGLISRDKLKDYKYSLKYYVKGCELNDSASCLGAGYVSEVSLINVKKAKPFYEKGCKLKNNGACYNLGLIYRYDKIKGTGDIKKAKEYYAKACKLGNKKACAAKFDTVAKNNNRKEVELSDKPEDLYKLAVSYQKKKDYFNANLLFSKACTKNHINSCDYLGYNYEQGYGYSKSMLMAKKHYSENCERKSGYACNKMGYFYQKGIQVKKNLKQARIFYKKSCNLKYALACSNLADLFKFGIGIKKDDKIARILYKKACKLGYKKACGK